MNEYPQGIWNATEYFRHLTATNRLAKSEGFTFCSVSGLDGFEEALDHQPRGDHVEDEAVDDESAAGTDDGDHAHEDGQDAGDQLQDAGLLVEEADQADHFDEASGLSADEFLLSGSVGRSLHQARSQRPCGDLR